MIHIFQMFLVHTSSRGEVDRRAGKLNSGSGEYECDRPMSYHLLELVSKWFNMQTLEPFFPMRATL